MNLLNINVKDFLPDLIDAYTEVYGKEYRNIIEERLNRTFFILKL